MDFHDSYTYYNHNCDGSYELYKCILHNSIMTPRGLYQWENAINLYQIGYQYWSSYWHTLCFIIKLQCDPGYTNLTCTAYLFLTMSVSE